jgi:hypothetical protein
MDIGDIVIHINEELSATRIHELERDLAEDPGIYCACVHENTHHLLVVDFDPEEVRPSHIVHSIRNRGLHAQMIGL